MKDFICKKAFFVNGMRVASVGDHLILFDNGEVKNNNSGEYIVGMPDMSKDKEHFIPTFETAHQDTSAIDEKVDHPSHYTWIKKKCGIEVIDITRWLDFNTGNAVKYLLRAGHKLEEGMSAKEKTIQDLKKAVWYINDRIKQLQAT